MKVSLKLIKKYVNLPKDLSDEKIAYDLTLRTVEVESVVDAAKKYHDIVVGKIIEVNNHPDADKLKVCMVDIGLDKNVQIVCGGSNLYKGELVVVCKPGAEVIWHGQGDAIVIKETKMRGVSSYGMICASEEVFLSEFFPAKDEAEIIDLSGIDCKPGDLISDVVFMNDTILEIDNKSLSNRPDLWGHLGIARELSAIYHVPLKEQEKIKLDENLPKYNVEIKESNKCNRYVAIEIDGIYEKQSPLWMQSALVKCGSRPINAIVDITNYVMYAVGQPLHAFDKTHVDGETIVVRNALENEELLLLDHNTIKLTNDDLVVSDINGAMALAGIRGGSKDSILPTTKGIVLEVANFSAGTIRKTGKRFQEKTDASIRYEKGVDTQRVDLGVDLALKLIKEIFPDAKIVKYADVYPVHTKNEEIDVSKKFLNERLGKEISEEVIVRILTDLGYEVSVVQDTYHVVVPTYRSTGDVSIKDDVMGDIARILSFDSFEEKPINITIEHSINQRKVLLEKRITEYLANRCGFYEIFTYPWIDEKFITAAGIDVNDSVKLATPPAPELVNLRTSLVPGLLEAVLKNLRYYDKFNIFECAQVFKKGSYSPSSKDEVLPIQNKHLAGAIVGKDAKEIFFQLKGVIEQMARYTHMEDLVLESGSKASWADNNAHLVIKLGDKVIGSMGLVSIKAMSDVKIKRTNIACFEINFDELIPFASRDNKFEHLPELPLVEKDLSILVSEDVSWATILQTVKGKVKEVEFIDVYRGNQIPLNMKSVTFKVKMINEGSTMTMEEINDKMDKILTSLNKRCGAKLREE